MAYIKNIVALFALCAILSVAFGQASQGGPHTAQGGPHQNQGRIRRQVNQDSPANEEGTPDDNERELPVWTTCDFTADPKLSCHDCNTRLICKPVGGLLKTCGNPYRPHCNNGICSATPSAGCS